MISAAFEGYPVWATGALALAAVFVVAYLVAEGVSRFAWKALRPMLGARAAGFAAAPLLRPVRLIRMAVFLLTGGALILPAMELAGVDTFVGLDPLNVAEWLFSSGLRIGLILLLAYTIVRVASLIMSRFEQDVIEAAGTDYLEQAKRVRTLGNLLRSTLGVLVTCVATLMILRELNLDITPILTGAGIAGLAVGFGAQTLVKDVISGFFLLLENQVRVGDVAAINGTGGLVEAITLRTIVLRDEAGTVHIFPNGSITTLANMTKDFSYYVLNIGVEYHEDTDRVVEVLREVADEQQRDPRYSSAILQPLEVLGVDGFAESQIIVKARIKTVPQKQWDVGRELRRRIKKRFDAEGIAFPTRQLTLTVAAGALPLPEKLANDAAAPQGAPSGPASGPSAGSSADPRPDSPQTAPPSTRTS